MGRLLAHTRLRRNPDTVLQALQAAAPPPLHAWLADHASDVRSVILRAKMGVEGGAHVVAARMDAAAERGAREAWTLDEAVRWMTEAAAYLASNTHFDPTTGAMLEDMTGASGSTYAGLQNYAYIGTEADLPIDAHLRAAELLRVHSGKQLRREDWEAAYAAVKAAHVAQGGGDAPASKRIYDVTRSPKSGLKDGSHYERSEDGKRFRVALPFKRGGPRAGDLLTDAGFVKNRDYRWAQGLTPDGHSAYWLIAEVTMARAIADALQEHYPVLADALRQNAPVWSREQVAPERPAPVAAGGDGLDPRQGSVVDAGRGDPFQWEMLNDRQIAVKFPYMKGPLLAQDLRFVWHEERKRNGDWWAVFSVVPDNLAKLHAALLRERRPRAAAAVEALAPEWGKGLMHGGSVEAQVAAGADPSQPEGRWEVTPSGYVKLLLPWRGQQAKDWHKAPGITAIVQTRKRPTEDPKKPEWFHYFRTARAWLIADAIAPWWPNTAAALVQAFGSKRRTFDEEAVRCNPLSDMSNAAEPKDVRNPIGQAVLQDVAQALATRLPMNPATGKQLAPFPYQHVGISFAKLTNYRCMIADAMGLGKTIQALGSLIVDPDRLLPTVICAPAAVLLKWRSEIVGDPITGKVGWAPNMNVHVLADGKTKMPPPGWKGVILCTWTLLRKHVDALIAFGVRCFIGDEAHYVKNPDAQMSQAAMQLSENVQHMILLTGTPIENRVMEFYNLLSMLDPETWGTAKQYGERFTRPREQPIGRGRTVTVYEGTRNEETLKELLSCVMVRRLKRDVAKHMPPKTRVPQPLELTADEVKEYNRVVDGFEDWLYAQKEMQIREAYAKRGRDASDAEIAEEVEKAVERSMKAEPLVKVGYMRRAMGVAKSRSVAEMVIDMVAQGEPVVVFAEHQPVVAALQDAFTKAKIRHVTIDGNTPNAKEKDKRWREFQAGKFDIFIGSQAAREGIDLYRSTNVVFAERWWNPARENQAEDRCHRIVGTVDPVTIWFPYVPGTIDDKMNLLLEKKRQIAEKILGAEDIKTMAADDLPNDIGEALAQLAGEGRIGGGGKGGRTKKNPRGAPKKPQNLLPAASEVQSIMFDRSVWTVRKARDWLKMHGYSGRVVDTVGKHHRFRQADPQSFAPGTFRTITFTPTVKAVTARPGR